MWQTWIRAVVLYSCRYYELVSIQKSPDSILLTLSLNVHPDILAARQDTDSPIALRQDALAKIGFSNASHNCKTPQKKRLALPADDWCETSVFRRTPRARLPSVGLLGPDYHKCVLWWWIATVKYKHLNPFLPFYSQIHQLTSTTWDHQICAFNCQAGHQTSDVIRRRRLRLICSWYVSPHPPLASLIQN